VVPDPPDIHQDELERLVPVGQARASRPGQRRGDTTLGTGPEPFGPRTAGEILDVTLDVMRERFMILVGTCILLWFPLRLVMPFIAPHKWLQETELQIGAGAMFLFISLLGGLVTVLGEAVVAQLTAATLEERTQSLGEAFAYAGRRIIPIGVLAFLCMIVKNVGCMCLVAPGVFLAWKFWVAQPALVLEQLPMGTAIQRSFDLTTGTFGRWAGVAATRFVFVTVLSFSVGMPDDPTLRSAILDAVPISGTLLDVINVFVSSIFLGTVTALSGVVVTVFYLDCRIRRDGYDLDLALDRIAARHSPARADAGDDSGGPDGDRE
jgi:hypothetical protein